MLGIANVTARSRIQPKTTETTTDMYMPTAADREAWCVSSAMCADASKPVIVYWDISRPETEHEPEHGVREVVGAASPPAAGQR